MRRPTRLLLATLVAVGATTIAAAPAALAAAPAAAVAQGGDASCDEVVTGPASLDAGDLARATAVTAELDATREVYARARIIEGPYPGELAGWVDEQLVACPAWSTGELVLRDDMLLLVVDIGGRTVGSFFGADLEPQLEPARNVVTDAMRDDLVAARWAAAVAVGMDGYAQELGIASGASPSPLPWVLGGAAALGAGGLGAVGLTKRRRRKGVQGQAVEARTATMSAWFDLESRWETIEAGVTVMTRAVHPDDGVAATLEQEADEAERAMASVRDELLSVPDPADVTTQAMADDAVAAWSRLGERVAAVTVEVDEVDAAVTALSDAKHQAPARIEEAVAQARAADEAVARITAQTFDGIPLRAQAAASWAQDANRGAEAARGALEQGRFGDAVMAADAAVARAAEAVARAAQVPAFAVELPLRAKELANQAAAAVTTAVSSRNALTTLRSQWRRTVWDDISDAPERARDLAEEAGEVAALAAAASSMAEQDWEAAVEHLEHAEALLAESAELAAAPRRRDEEAKAQLTTARQSLLTAQDRLAKADATLQATKADVTVHRQALVAAGRQLTKGLDLLADKPDPIRAQQMAVEAGAAIDRATSGAQQVIDVWDRETQRAGQTLDQARRDLAQADRDRPRARTWNADLRRADDLLDEAAALLDQSPAEAADRAQRALDLAQRIIREKRRERDRDRDQWRAPRGGSVSGPLGGVLGGVLGRGGSGGIGMGGGIGGGTSRGGGSVMGGSPTRQAPRSTPRPSPASPRRHGGGTSKF